MLGVVGIAATIAFLGLFMYILVAVASVFFGKRETGVVESVFNSRRDTVVSTVAPSTHGFDTPGTVMLTLIFLATFAVYFFANLKWLSNVWWVR